VLHNVVSQAGLCKRQRAVRMRRRASWWHGVSGRAVLCNPFRVEPFVGATLTQGGGRLALGYGV